MTEQTLLTTAAAPGAAFVFEPSQRYPDPRIEVLHPSFAKYRIFSSTVELLGSGMRWAEGPVWFGDGRCVLVSDIPSNRIMRYDEATGAWGVFRAPSNFANGLCRDLQGRLLACEHGGRASRAPNTTVPSPCWPIALRSPTAHREAETAKAHRG